MRPFRTFILLALVCAPIFAAYALHWGASVGHPTGFLQGDQAYYMSNARQYLDVGSFSPLYSLPFSANAETPRIYFQPLTAVLAASLWITGGDPGVIYTVAGCLAALLMCFTALAALRVFVQPESRGFWIVFLLFFWGGGLLCMAGMADYFLLNPPTKSWLAAFRQFFDYDPSDGYWFLNLGRNALFTTEAAYHALVLALIVALTRQRWTMAVILLALIGFSSPYPGVMALITAFGWWLLERWVSSVRPPNSFGYAVAGLLLFYLAYYLVFLGWSSEDHRHLVRQWELDYRLSWLSNALALAPLIVMTVIRLVKSPMARSEMLGTPMGRLLLMVASVTTLLSHHDVFISPRQPIHFDRGYAWMALFLLNAKALTGFVGALWSRHAGRAVVLLIVLCALLDNILWFAHFPLRRTMGKEPFPGGITLTTAEQAALGDLAKLAERAPVREPLLVSSNDNVAYLATTYTRLRPWHSHPFNTPEFGARKAEAVAAFAENRCAAQWSQTPTLYVAMKPAALGAAAGPCGSRPVIQAADYTVFANFKPSVESVP